MAKFEKGESGNPGGRPKGLGEIREIARTHTDDAIKTLVKVMNATDASPSARVAAASALLDRGWGRPQQSIDLTTPESLSDTLQRIAEHRQAELAKSNESKQPTHEGDLFTENRRITGSRDSGLASGAAGAG